MKITIDLVKLRYSLRYHKLFLYFIHLGKITLTHAFFMQW